MKKAKNKNLRRTLGLIALALAVALLSVMPLLASENAPEPEHPLSILSARAETRQLRRGLSAGGVLAQEESEAVTVPSQVKITQFLVENGDVVRAGDPIAKVDRVTVMQAIAETQEAMDTLAKQLEKARTDATTATIYAPTGLVKAVYAQPGDLVADVMLAHGCLVLVSLDSLMAVQLEVETDLLAGDTVRVTVGGETVVGTVKQNLTGILTVTLPDNGYAEGEAAAVADSKGNALGEGRLYIHAPWRAVAYQGTVGTVYAKEGQKLYSNATLLTIKDMGYSAEYRSLAAQHRAYEEQMLELFQIYQSLTLTAPCDGVVSGIDKNSTQLLAAQEGWQVTLLVNAPNGDDSQQYYNLVGQVLSINEEDYSVKLRMNPAAYSVTDYTNTSGVPRDTSLMTETVDGFISAPVYRWVVNADPGEDDSQEKDPSQPPEGSDPPGDSTDGTGSGNPDAGETEAPGDGEDPGSSGGTEGSTPPGGTENPGGTETPGETETPSAANGSWIESGYSAGDILLFGCDSSGRTVWIINLGRGPLPGEGGAGGYSGGFGGFGGITIPGYGAYGGGTTQEEQAYGTNEATVALVTPQNILTLPVTIDELDLHLVCLGQEVEITVDALVGQHFVGTVTEIGQTGANNGGSSKFTVTVTLDQQKDMLSGMNAAITIPLGEESGVCVPVSALYQEGVRSFVYTALDEETGEPAGAVEVTTGYSDGEYVLVYGLEEGTSVYYGYYEALNTGVSQMPQGAMGMPGNG